MSQTYTVYRFVLILCGFNAIVIGLPSVSILRHKEAESCSKDFLVLPQTFQTATFKIVGLNFSSVASFDYPYVPALTSFLDEIIVCQISDRNETCTLQTFRDYSCHCEEFSNGDVYLTFTQDIQALTKSFSLYVAWVDRDSNQLVESDTVDFKEVREWRDCWTPTIEILATDVVASCDDYLVIGFDTQMVMFNISWSNSDYLVDWHNSPRVVNASSGQTLCPLIDFDFKCTLNNYVDYFCLCEEIIPNDEYHLTFMQVPIHTFDSFTIHLKWKGLHGSPTIVSEDYTFLEVKENKTENCTSAYSSKKRTNETENLKVATLSYPRLKRMGLKSLAPLIAIGALVFFVWVVLTYFFAKRISEAKQAKRENQPPGKKSEPGVHQEDVADKEILEMVEGQSASVNKKNEAGKTQPNKV